MLWYTFRSKLKLDDYNRIFVGIIRSHNADYNTAIFTIDITDVSSPTKYDELYPFSPPKKNIFGISPRKRILNESHTKEDNLVTPIGVALHSIPIGTKIAFSGYAYNQNYKNKIDPQSMTENSRVALDNQYLEVVGFNSTIAKKVLKHQQREAKDDKDLATWLKKLDEKPFFEKLLDKLSPYLPEWLVKPVIVGVIVTVIGGIILLMFGESIAKKIFQFLGQFSGEIG